MYFAENYYFTKTAGWPVTIFMAYNYKSLGRSQVLLKILYCYDKNLWQQCLNLCQEICKIKNGVYAFNMKNMSYEHEKYKYEIWVSYEMKYELLYASSEKKNTL